VAVTCREYVLDVLSCVTLDRITNENFKNRRSPQIPREVEALKPRSPDIRAQPEDVRRIVAVLQPCEKWKAKLREVAG
ncbi:MAG: hypothetical protein ACRET2_09790, partial [Steroidobacteraceae bacterium]